VVFFSARKDPRQGAVYRVAERHRREVLQAENSSIKAMVAAYEVAEKAILREQKKLERKILEAKVSGVEVSKYWLFQQDRYRTYSQAVATELRVFNTVASRQGRGLQETLTMLGLAHGTEKLSAIKVNGSFVRFPKEQVLDLVGFLRDGSPLVALFESISPTATSALRETLIEGVTLGRNPRVIARDLAKATKELTLDRAMLIGRTEGLRPYRTAQTRNYRANSDVLTGWEYASARDVRTCPICLGLDGQIFPVDVEFAAAHPLCRCAPIPVSEFSTTQSFEDFARGLSPSELAEYDLERKLGPTRWKAWQEGRTLREFVGETNSDKWGPGFRMKTLGETGLDPVGRAPVVRGKPPAAKVPQPVLVSPSTPSPVSPAAVTPVQNNLSVSTSDSTIFDGQRNVALLKAGSSTVNDVALMNGYLADIGIDASKLRIKVQVSNYNPQSRGEQGFFLPEVGSIDAPIAISNAAVRPRMTLAHEFGHALDFGILPGDDDLSFRAIENKKKFTGEIGKAMEGFVAAFKASGEYQFLGKLHRAGINRKYVKYLMSYHEGWARAFAQFVAVESGDTAMLSGLADQLAKQAADADFPFQFADFQPIRDAIKEVLKWI
jgi:SPP1 gp7 family putative phage head morphogenesis protein